MFGVEILSLKSKFGICFGVSATAIAYARRSCRGGLTLSSPDGELLFLSTDAFGIDTKAQRADWRESPNHDRTSGFLSWRATEHGMRGCSMNLGKLAGGC